MSSEAIRPRGMRIKRTRGLGDYGNLKKIDTVFFDGRSKEVDKAKADDITMFMSPLKRSRDSESLICNFRHTVTWCRRHVCMRLAGFLCLWGPIMKKEILIQLSEYPNYCGIRMTGGTGHLILHGHRGTWVALW